MTHKGMEGMEGCMEAEEHAFSSILLSIFEFMEGMEGCLYYN